MMIVRFREYVHAGAIFALMVAIFFWPLFSGHILSQADTLYFFPPWNAVRPPDLGVPSNTVLNDQTREFLPFFQVARESFRQKEFPLWNPYIMAGTPLLANSQSALFFPLNWFFYLFPLPFGFTVSALLKMFIASLATYAFARKISLSHPAALMAGTTYTFSTFNVFWLNHPHTNVTVFFPLLLFLTQKVIENPSLRSMAALALAVGVQLLGGHVEIAFHVALAVTLFFLFQLVEYRRDGQAMLLRLRTFVCGYTLGFFLAAVLMAPFFEFLSQSATWEVRSAKNPFAVHPMGLISLILSDFFVKPAWPFDISPYHAVSLYTGICPLIFSLVSLSCQRRRVSLFFAGLSLFGLAIAYGVPPFFSLLTSLPLFRQTPNYYMVLFHVLSISLLGGMGLHLIQDAEGNDALRGRVKKILIGTGLILPLLAAGFIFLVLKTPFLSPIIKGVGSSTAEAIGQILSQIGSNLIRSAFLVGCALTLLAAPFFVRPPKGSLEILAIAVTFGDLFIAGAGWNPVVPGQWGKISLPPAVHFLQQDKEVYRVAGIGSVMPPNTATLCGLQDIRGYDVPVEDRYHHFFREALKGKSDGWIYDLPEWHKEALALFSLLNVKYILSVNPLPPPLSLVYDKEVKIYLNPNSFPRAFVACQSEAAEDGDTALRRVLTLGPELKRIVILEGTTPEGSGDTSPPGTGEKAKGRARILKYTARRVEVEVETSSAGFLVLGDTYFPGWKAYLDGSEVPLYRADYLLRAVAVGKGSHRVVFLYRPLSFTIGLGLTILSGGIIVGCLCLRKRGVPF